jgi:hypothetical protein
VIGETEHGAVVQVMFEQVASVVTSSARCRANAVPAAFGTLWAYISRKGFSRLDGS